MLNLNDVVLFATAVESGGFAAASRRLGVPKSTISKRVAALEDEPLDFVRDFKTVRDLLARLDSASTQRALARLRATLAAHETGVGVLFDARSWIVTARRAGP